MRPKRRVMPSHMATAVPAPDNASGKICILAIHPKAVAILLSSVTSSSTMAANSSMLTVTRVIFSMRPIVNLYFLRFVSNDMWVSVNGLYDIKDAGIPSRGARQRWLSMQQVR